MSARFVMQLVVALLRRPRLFPTAVRQLRRLAPDRWWARGSHLPLPDADYLAFRQLTSTGSADGPPDLEETLTWLEWCRSMRSLPGSS